MRSFFSKEHLHDPTSPESEKKGLVNLEHNVEVRSEGLRAKGARLAEEADVLARNHPELKERALGLKERADRLTRFAAKTLRLFTILASIGLAAGYADKKITTYQVTESSDADNGPQFRHEDKETTIILEYLSGRTDLPRDAKLSLIKNIIDKSKIKESGIFQR